MARAVSGCAVVPAFNEAERIGETVRALLERVAPRVLVIDDGSVDETARKAREAGAEVVRSEVNRGKGDAVNRGLEEVLRGGPVDWVLLADADLGASAANLAALVEPVIARTADLAIARFSAGGGFGFVRRVAREGIRLLTGSSFVSPLSGQRALSMEAVQAVYPLPSGWGMEVYMTVRALWEGLRVVEVPLALRHRVTGRDVAGFRHRGRQCAAVLAALGALAWERLRARGPKRRVL